MKKKVCSFLVLLTLISTASFAQKSINNEMDKEKINPDWKEMSAKADVYIMKKNKTIVDADMKKKEEVDATKTKRKKIIPKKKP